MTNRRDREADDDRERDDAGVGAGSPVGPTGSAGVLGGVAEPSPESDAAGDAEPGGDESRPGTVKEAGAVAFRANVWPPFDVRKGDYHGLTYPGHTPYAVDFNRGWGTTDWNDPVLASAAGTIISIDPAYGAVWLAHPFGVSTMYAHMRRIVVRVGQRVVSGQQLGSIGRTHPGLSYMSPHLHYQQLQFGYAVPVQFYGKTYPASVQSATGVFIGPLVHGHVEPQGG